MRLQQRDGCELFMRHESEAETEAGQNYKVKVKERELMTWICDTGQQFY